jgi:hypothetical protein
MGPERSDYTPASSLGWLDFDAAATERVATLLRALQEPATLDVLGLGSVRDAFSEMLHPGTSYIHTRLRYFMFLPWIFQRLETEQVAPVDFFRRLRRYEAQLIDCLRHLGPGKGVIGYQAGRNLKRMPSTIYWGGLGAWGLRRLPLSLGEYAQRVAALGRYRAARDDDGNVTDRTGSMWAQVPEPPDNFLETDINFELGPEEARILIDNIRRRHGETLLALLCVKPESAADYRYPWEVPEMALTGRVAETLRHARCFSELTAGPQYAYNILVARRARQELGWDTARLEERQLGHLQGWVTLVGNRRSELRSWVDDLGALWAHLPDRIHPRTREFIDVVVKLAVNNPEGFADNPVAHDVIRRRELVLKGSRARLAHRAALEYWSGGAAGGQFEYRWSIARGYLGEIAKALRSDR